MPARGTVPGMRTLTALLTACAATAIVAGCASPAPPPTDDSVVRTVDGAVRGTVTDDVRRFQGIPYAAAPVGELRWRSPEPAKAWPDVRDGTRPGAPCPQAWPGEDGTPQVSGSEDCLFLNVTTPSGAVGPRPVMVFVHGGGFTGGQGAPYDPTRVVTQGGVVVVTMNYRLGALGFLAHPAFDDPAAGNFGLVDQQAALRWVRDNIAAFGGDPGNVTLWGESAGAFSTCAQLAAPGARGLFHKAIVQSGPCANPVVTREEAQRRGVTTAAELGCPDTGDTVACLRALPPEAFAGRYDERVYRQVHRDLAARPWLPVAGTPALPQHPVDALRAGTAADVPMIHGGTRDEARSHVAMAYDMVGSPLTAGQYPQVVAALFGADADAVVAGYPVSRYPSPGLALATALSDDGRTVGACTQQQVVDTASGPVFTYEFAEPVDDVIGSVPMGAHHGADVRYFFDSAFPGAPPASRTAEEDALAGRLIGYWTAFAATGSPGPDWPAADGATVLQIDAEGSRPIDLAAEHRCDFWRSPPSR